MAWAAAVNLDRDDLTIGSVTATYTDAGIFATEPFVYSRRASVSGADAIAFRAEAKAALALETPRREQDAILSAQLTTFMNQE